MTRPISTEQLGLGERILLILIFAIGCLVAWDLQAATAFQREVIPCSDDGTRQAKYPSGGTTCADETPSVTADYLEDWSGFSVSTNAYAALNLDADLQWINPSKTPAQDALTFQIVSTPARDSTINKSFHVRNDGQVYDSGTGSAQKHRAEYRFAKSTAVEFIEENVTHCIGYSLYLSSTGWKTGTSDNLFIGQLVRANPFLVFQYQDDANSDGIIRMQTERLYGNFASPTAGSIYRYKKNATNHTASTAEWYLDRWYDIVLQINFESDSAASTWRLWVKDTTDGTETLMVDESGVQIGFSDDGQQDAFWKLGSYWGKVHRSAIYRAYFGPIRMHEGPNCKSVVQPSGTPTGNP